MYSNGFFSLFSLSSRTEEKGNIGNQSNVNEIIEFFWLLIWVTWGNPNPVIHFPKGALR
jgi:hypothetical protein